ncbi:sulfur carrier protein [Nocardiopsis mwathae]|uniref:Sulfur carrier protein n=1 Tax=Nocardiopsis mwathae TaxID=1472723 RepID=A0A7W9YI09_9ACTN|nr:sulfur carrier protein [Nocardiopsis mwathae]
MKVIINGEPRDLAPRSTVADAVRTLTEAREGIAVAVNDEVVPKATWATTVVSENDRVDVLTAVQGG